MPRQTSTHRRLAELAEQCAHLRTQLLIWRCACAFAVSHHNRCWKSSPDAAASHEDMVQLRHPPVFPRCCHVLDLAVPVVLSIKELPSVHFPTLELHRHSVPNGLMDELDCVHIRQRPHRLSLVCAPSLLGLCVACLHQLLTCACVRTLVSNSVCVTMLEGTPSTAPTLLRCMQPHAEQCLPPRAPPEAQSGPQAALTAARGA